MVVIVLVIVGLMLILASRLVWPQRRWTGQMTPLARVLRRAAGWSLLLAGGLALLVGVVVGGVRIYLTLRLASLPPVETTLSAEGALASIPVSVASNAPQAPSRNAAPPPAIADPARVSGPVSLPPTQIKIPRIDVNAPVALSDVDYQLRFKAVGWMVGSAFPGAVGNLVLFGEASGPYATFTRLGELRPGDEIIIVAPGVEVHYRVRSVAAVAEDNVDIMAATTTPVATLITDTPDNERQRLVVLADLASP